MPFKHFLIVFFLLNVTLSACGQSPREVPAPLTLTAVSSGLENLGDSKSMEAVWISSEDQWTGLIDRTSGNAKILIQPVARPHVDFAKYGVLMIRMGEKPTGGYRLQLMADTAEVENRTALVPVRWIEPEKGAITTQAITYPYLMIRIPTGSFDRIAVVDQDGTVRFRLDVTD
jgi:hypothetical protein